MLGEGIDFIFTRVDVLLPLKGVVRFAPLSSIARMLIELFCNFDLFFKAFFKQKLEKKQLVLQKRSVMLSVMLAIL